MAIKKILTYPDPALRQKAEKVTEFNEELQQLAQDLAETMYDAPGSGLAATQIGCGQRVVVIDMSKDKEKREYMVLVNPEILECEGSQVDEEGCLSVIDLSAKVKRYRKILIRVQELDGKVNEFPAEDFFARVLQHEIDHLDGILFIDHLSSLKRGLYKKRLKKILKEQEEEDAAD